MTVVDAEAFGYALIKYARALDTFWSVSGGERFVAKQDDFNQLSGLTEDQQCLCRMALVGCGVLDLEATEYGVAYSRGPRLKPFAQSLAVKQTMYAQGEIDVMLIAPRLEALSFEDQRHLIFLMAIIDSGVTDWWDEIGCNRERMIAKALGIDADDCALVKNRLLTAGFIDEDWKPVGL